MPRAPKSKGPTEAERSALAVLLFDTCLFSAHGIIVQNVRDGVSALLRMAGRPDLADVWDNPEEQDRQFGRSQS